MADYKDITDWKDYNYLLDRILEWEDNEFSICLSMRVRSGDTYNTVYSYRTKYGGNKNIGVTTADVVNFTAEGLFYGLFAYKDGYDYSFPEKLYNTVSSRFIRVTNYVPEYMLILKRRINPEQIMKSN